ncbi:MULTISPECIES: DedA family protein [unclassified Coleofasciculus]|uniref:DedA family protein n=1 Tax=unclassified Coleofasciculus TaxID=2692782 RepID=UPI00188227E1|nr:MULTISPECIES: DedA family protein [unclassified Coleofasciculus]MBE9125036.1 DedA family protein [Coleofasciculus sp. LEGE 07081]MBE9147644.1 DedA family protein [Coleofasciculus sp. LEGE 07092]
MSFELLSLETIQELARQYGYWAVFFGIALENTGVPLPGETITLVGGFLAGSGELNYWLVLGSAITGAALGDNFGYWIGRIGGLPFLMRAGRLFRISETQLTEAKRQFSENAARAVFFGRFVALLRIFAGPMAGIAEMPYLQFLACNFAGATLWASVMVSIAFFVGRIVPVEILISRITQFGIVALLLVIAWIAIRPWLESRKVKQSSVSDHPSASGE